MNKILFVLLAVAFFSCQQTGAAKIDDVKRERSESEIKTSIQTLVDAAAHADTAQLFSIFSFSDRFLFVDVTGETFGSESYKHMVSDFWKDVKTELISGGKDSFHHIGTDDVMWTHTGSIEVNFKDGSTLKIEPFSISILFRKIEGHWKGVFAQESGQMPVPAGQPTVLPVEK